MSRGFLNHIWYKLLDEEGVPLDSASVWLYKYGTTDELIVFDENENYLSQPLTTNSLGVLEFYVKDHIRPPTSGSYYWDDQYIISWLKDDKSGIIRGDKLFGEYESVDETGSLDIRNKAVSDYLGWLWESHTSFQFGTTTRCGSSSSSSSSVSSSSSSSLSNSSVSSSSSSSCTPQYQETLFPTVYSLNNGTMPEVEGKYTLVSDGSNIIDIDVVDLTGYESQPQSIKITCYLVGTSSFTSLIVKNSNNDIVHSGSYNTGLADGIVTFYLTSLNWQGFDAGNFYFQSSGSITIMDLQFWEACGSTSSYSSSSSSSQSVGA